MRSSVRSRLAPPAFARAASEGCRAEALLAKAGWWPRARAWRARSPLGEGGLVAASYGLASPKPSWRRRAGDRELRLGEPEALLAKAGWWPRATAWRACRRQSSRSRGNIEFRPGAHRRPPGLTS